MSSSQYTLRLNRHRCTEIVFVDPRRRRSAELPPLLAGVERVTTMKIHGVIVTNMLSVVEHVQAIIRACAPSIHALRLLRCHRLNDVAALQTAYRAIIVATPAPGGALPPLTTVGAFKVFWDAVSRLVFIDQVGPLWRTLWKTLTMSFLSCSTQ